MIEQGTDAWKAERCGKVTASRIADLMAKTKNGWGASRANYLAELVAERLTGAPAERYINAAMQWGTDTEAEARAAYQFETTTLVERVGFIPHPTIAMCGASPDGFVGSDGLLELKCPLTSTHIETLLGREAPSKYVLQMQWQMACTGRQWCDFASFDPRMPEHMRLFICRVRRDADKISEITGAVNEFLKELDDKVTELTKRYGVKEAA
jgi:putative phage-type endonuclease